MGTSCSTVSVKDIETLKKEYNSKQFFNAYLNIKNVLINDIYDTHDEKMPSKEFYLIKTGSINKFITILDQIFDFLEEEKKDELNNEEERIKKEFEDFILKEETAIIYSDYKLCEKIFKDKKNTSGNNFIIVDKNFIRNFEIRNANFMNVNMKIKKDNNECSIEIKFPASQKIIYAREKKDEKGFFEFYKSEEKTDNSNNNLKSEDNEKEEERFKPMIKSICYCLINIGSLKSNFFLNGDDINKGIGKICKIFFGMIE